MLNRLKEAVENMSDDKKFIIKENKNIINIVKHILYFNELDQSMNMNM